MLLLFPAGAAAAAAHVAAAAVAAAAVAAAAAEAAAAGSLQLLFERTIACGGALTEHAALPRAPGIIHGCADHAT